MRLSIIVPAYKVSDFIEKCLISLEQQDIPHSDYEIIVINDGSPDDSAAIVTRMQASFPNILLLNQANQGVSVARNNGIAQARGKYIMAIDPDDYVLPNTFQRILDKADAQQLDVFYLNFEIFDAHGKSVWQTNFTQLEDKIFDGVSGYYAPRVPDGRDPNRSWAILYRREMLEKYSLKYPKDVPFLEDGAFLVKVFAVAERVGFDVGKFHQRTTSKGSATVTGVYHTEKAINGFLKAAADLREFSEANRFGMPQQGLLNHGMANFVLLSLFSQVSLGKIKALQHTIKKIKATGFSQLQTQGVVDPYRTYAIRFNISPYFFLALYATQMVYKRLTS